VPDVERSLQDLFELIQGDHIRSIRRRVVGIGVGLEKERIRAGCRRGV
jgi:hypothetical protein